MAFRSRGGWSIRTAFLVALPVSVFLVSMNHHEMLRFPPGMSLVDTTNKIAYLAGYIPGLPLTVALVVMLQNLIVRLFVRPKPKS